jgi:hypothetical protein
MSNDHDIRSTPVESGKPENPQNRKFDNNKNFSSRGKPKPAPSQFERKPEATGSRAEREFEQAFAKYVSVQADPELWEILVPIEPSVFLTEFCQELYDLLDLSSVKPLTFSMQDVLEVGTYLINARMAYTSGIKVETHPRDIEYPALFGPVLATIGKYTDQERNIVLIPVPQGCVELRSMKPKQERVASEPSQVEVERGTTEAEMASGPDQLSGEAAQEWRVKRDAMVKKPTHYERTIAAMRTLGVPTIFGLPMDKIVPTDDFFRIALVEDILIGAQPKAPSPVALFARALVNFVYLESCFGAARVSYASMGSMRIGMRELVMLNVDGPKMRT